MYYQEVLLKQKAEFERQLSKQKEHHDYYEMLVTFTSALIQLSQQVQGLKNQLKAYECQWLNIMDELCESLQMFQEESFIVVKGKKIYETVDEVVADLEDWIETVNEHVEEALPYIEAWDIGVFFK